jgi:hypothetical protein
VVGIVDPAALGVEHDAASGPGELGNRSSSTSVPC